MKRLVLLFVLLMFLWPVQAQEAFLDYRWEFGDLALRYPNNWDEPVQRFSTDGNQVMLMLAQELVDSPERPATIPFITLSLLRSLEADTVPYEELENALEAIGINPVGELPAVLFGAESLGSQGYSQDGLLFGIGRIHYLDEARGSLMIIGRAPTEQREEFLALFNSIASSITITSSEATFPPPYGILWQQQQDFSDGENALLDIAAMTLGEDGRLYIADRLVGIVALDSQTGIIQTIMPFEEEIEPSALLMSNNRFYLADTLCSCIHIYENGREIAQERNFGEFAPHSIALGTDGSLYATEILEEQIVIRSMNNRDSQLLFDLPPLEQPLLTIDRAGRLLVLADNTLLYALQDGILTLQYELQASVFPTAITVDYDNQLLVATNGDGIMVFNNLGELVNQIPTESTPTGIAVGADGILYWASSDGVQGTITALSLGVEQGRIGASNLRSGLEVMGSLDEGISRQLWTFDGLRGDVIALTALADFDSINLDLAMRLLDPAGREIATADNDDLGYLANFLDAQIRFFSLPEDGQYYVIVERREGEGAYRLGFNRSSLIPLDETGQAEVTGILRESMPLQRWVFEGSAGQAATITLQSSDGTIDPVLFLLNSRGELLIENDDAEDPALGFDSQIFAFNLPSTGLYFIEASRFIGEGSYTLSVLLE